MTSSLVLPYILHPRQEPHPFHLPPSSTGLRSQFCEVGERWF